MISINNLSVKYKEKTVLSDFSLDLDEGKIYSLIGPSGCGKSTLLKVLCGIKKDYSGHIMYNAKAIEGENVSIGYVPQNYGLLEWKTVEENIYLPLILHKKKSSVLADEINDIIQSLEIGDLLRKYPNELSGGQKQRVALARAFMIRPQLLLMDEPFSALDAFTSSASQELFSRIWDKYKVTTLFITHNLSEAVSLGECILLMNRTSGKIVRRVDNTCFGVQGNDSERLKLNLDIKALFENILLDE